MIHKIHIQSFRSCIDVSLDNLTPTTLLVGRNGAGKSNILQAIDWMARTATGSPSRSPFDWAGPRTVGVEFSLGTDLWTYILSDQSEAQRQPQSFPRVQSNLHETLQIVSNSEIVASVKRDGESIWIDEVQRVSIPPSSLMLPALLSLLPADGALSPRIRDLIDYFAGIKYFDFEERNRYSENTGLVAGKDYQRWLDQTGWEWRPYDHLVIYQLLQMFLQDGESFAELKSLVGSDGLGILSEIEIKRFVESHKSHELEENLENQYFIPQFYTEKIQSFKSQGFSYEQLSVGTRRVLKILVALLSGQNTVFLCEHPEEGIHAGLAYKVFSLLRTYADPTQIILSSHSPLAFDAARPEDIRLVTMTAGRTCVRPLDFRETSVATRSMNHGGSLSDVLEIIESDQ